MAGNPGGFGEGIFDDDPTPQEKPSQSSPRAENEPRSPRDSEGPRNYGSFDDNFAPLEGHAVEPVSERGDSFDNKPNDAARSVDTAPSDDPGLFGGIVPIEEGFDAKAAALRRQRQESLDSRGVEALDDHVHGAEIPHVGMDDKRGNQRGRGRDRGDARGRGGEGRGRGGRERRPRRDDVLRPGGSPVHGGMAPRGADASGGFPSEFAGKPPMGRSIPGPTFDRMGPASMIEGPISGAPAYPNAPAVGSGYGGGGDVHSLRREIEDLRGQLQRSLSGGSTPALSSAYGDSGSRSAAPSMSASMPPSSMAPASIATLFAAQRVAILADVPSLQRTAKRIFGRVVSYSKLLQIVLRGRGAVRAIAFLAERDASDAAFLGHLRQTGFEIRRTEAPADGYRRSDAGASLAIEATRLANRVDSIVFASNDGDILNLLPALRAQGCRCEVAGFMDGVPEALRDAADAFHTLGREELI